MTIKTTTYKKKEKHESSLPNNFLVNYTKKRNHFTIAELEKLSNQLYQIKKDSIERLQELKQTCVKNMKSRGVIVHQVNSAKEAREAITKIIGQLDDSRTVVSAKSNTAKNIELDKIDSPIIKTDLGDFLAQVCQNDSGHAVLPALGLNTATIIKALKKKYKTSKEDQKTLSKIEKSNNNKAKTEKLVHFCMKKIRENILDATVGISGANALTSTGQIVLLENEGNISLVSRIPKKHIVIAGIEKIVPTVTDAMLVTKCAGIWGTGQRWTTYINIIDGPSKTADINNQLVFGAQGAHEVHLVLVDDWRSEFAKSKFKEILYCINCGACESVCPVFNSTGNIVKVLDPKFNYMCTTCKACTINCPAQIKWDKLSILARQDFIAQEQGLTSNQEMIKKIRKYGNPFGKTKKGEIDLDKMYCC